MGRVGLRFYRRVHLCPGLSVNLSRSGPSLTLGVRGAHVTLDVLQVGPLTARGVRALVNEGDLDQSLLGMSYLSSLGRVEIRGDALILER